MAEDDQGCSKVPEATPPEPGKPNVFSPHPPVDPPPIRVADSPLLAWQPLTPAGLARFAGAPFLRILSLQLVIALLTVAAVFACLAHAFFPSLRQAVQRLPDTGAIQNGVLFTPQLEPTILAEGRQLSFVLDVNEEHGVTAAGDFVVEMHRPNFRICSLLGCRVFPYPATAAFSRPELQPWWEAWEPNLYWIIGVGVIASLLFSWTLLAIAYAPVARLWAYFKDRELSWIGAWKLSAAALMPGAVLLTLGLAGYALDWIDLLRLAFLWPIHLLMGWIYVLLGVSRSPTLLSSEATPANPFTEPSAGTSEDRPPKG